MGRRGPKPKPKHILKIRGSWRAKKGGPEPELPPELAAQPIACPAHLAGEAKAEWERVAPLLAAVKLLTPLDRAAFAGYCQAWARWVEAEKIIARSGDVLKGDKGLYQNPYLAVANRALEHIAKFLAEFGLSPASRARVSADTSTGKGKDAGKGRFFNRSA
jgi:P27 family predicted phage terminase small subunit